MAEPGGLVGKVTDTLSGVAPLKYETGAEVARDIVVDYSAVTADSLGRKLIVKGELFTKITASGKYGPYDKTESDGRQTVALGSAVITRQDADVQLGDKAIGGWYHNCVFDVSELDLHGINTYAGPVIPSELADAFPTSTFDD